MAKSLVVRIIGDPTELSSALKVATAETETFGNKMGSVLKAGALVAAAGIGVAAFAIDKVVKAAMAGQVSQAALDRALKNTHQSVKAVTPALNAAEAAARKMGFSDIEAETALSRLETATGSTKKATSDLGVAMDIARFKHTDLTNASQMLAMAMTGSQRAAKQLGITVSPVTTNVDALKASHENLTTAIGKADEAQAKLADKMATGQAVIAAVTDKVHGQAQAFADTAAGGMAQFHAQLDFIEQKIGNALLPVMEKMLGWVNAHWPQITAVVSGVMRAVGVAIDAVRPYVEKLITWTSELVNYVRDHWAQISAFVTKAMVTVRSIITQVTTAAKALWAQFGTAVTQIAGTAFAATISIIRNAFNVIVGVFQLVGDLLHGRWSKVWEDIKKIVSNELQAIVTIIESAVSIAYTAALAVGKALVQGVIDGIKNLGSGIGGALGDAIHSGISAAKSLAKIFSPSQLTADELGAPLGEGIIAGFNTTTNSLANAMTATIQKAVAATKTIIATAQTTFEASFQGFQSIADQMFSGITGSAQTTAGKLIASLTAAHDAAALAANVTTARSGLASAKAGTDGVVDPAAVLAAQQALNDALYQQHIANLQKLDQAQQLDLTAQNQVKQIAFDNALAKLEEHLKKTGASTKTAMSAIQKLLSSYGVSFAAVGADMGKAWVQGLRDSIMSAAEGSATLKKIIGGQANQLGGLLGGIPQAADGGYVAESGLAVIHRGENIVPAGRGGSGDVHVYIDGREVFTAVQKHAKLDIRSGGLGVPG